MSVFTQEFFLLEGITDEGRVDIIAVAFDLKEMTSFVIGMASKKNTLEHFAFRITQHGGVIKPEPAPTHEGPAATI